VGGAEAGRCQGLVGDIGAGPATRTVTVAVSRCGAGRRQEPSGRRRVGRRAVGRLHVVATVARFEVELGAWDYWVCGEGIRAPVQNRYEY
jgi:hypothetical protein